METCHVSPSVLTGRVSRRYFRRHTEPYSKPDEAYCLLGIFTVNMPMLDSMDPELPRFLVLGHFALVRDQIGYYLRILG